MQGVARGKRMHQVCSRFPDEVIDEVDRYMRERENATRAPMSRSLVVLEIVEDWVRRRLAAAAGHPIDPAIDPRNS